jgi:hypothetical protein
MPVDRPPKAGRTMEGEGRRSRRQKIWGILRKLARDAVDFCFKEIFSFFLKSICEACFVCRG